MRTFQRGLIISDLHAPSQHQDLLHFLTALKRKYRPDLVLLTGDERDHHADSFHDHDPDLPSSGDEHDYAVAALKPLYSLFPIAEIMESNHGSLPERKALAHGLSAKYIKTPGERLGAPKGWRWHRQLILRSGDQQILFIHGHRRSANDLLLAQKRGVSLVQGHHHSKFSIQYFDTGNGPRWAMTAGCMVNPQSPAFAYGLDDISKQLLGCALIVDGVPRLLPFLLRNNRWTGLVP